MKINWRLKCLSGVILTGCSILSQLPPIVINPSPTPNHTPPVPLPSPTASPVPTPTPIPVPSVSPTPVPVPTPASKVCSDKPEGQPRCPEDGLYHCGCVKCNESTGFNWVTKPPCDDVPKKDPCRDCWTCEGLLQYQTTWGHLRKINDHLYENMGKYLNGKCETVHENGQYIGPPSWFLGDGCWPPPVCNAPSPSPSPVVSPSAEPTPVPSPTSDCDKTLYRVGIALYRIQEMPQIIKEGYLGRKFVLNSTPKSQPPYCNHRLDPITGAAPRECEQAVECQYSEGPDGYISLPGHFINDTLERNSTNPYLFQHVPKADETGLTTFRVCPHGDPITSARCSEKTVDIQ